MITRFAMLAMMAVGLSMGGYRLGTVKGTEQPLSPQTVRAPGAPAVPGMPRSPGLPADHPLSIALDNPQVSGLGYHERKQLEEMAKQYATSSKQIDQAVAASQEARVRQLKETQRALEAKLGALKAMKEATKAQARALAEQRAALTEQKRAAEIAIAKARNAATKGGRREESRVMKDRVQQTMLKANQSATLQELRLTQLSLKRLEAQSEVLATQEKRAVSEKLSAAYAERALSVLDPQSRQKVRLAAKAQRTLEASKGFVLMIAINDRDELELTPHKVTELQLLQADFIRRFAPLREAFETKGTLAGSFLVKDKFLTASAFQVKDKVRAAASPNIALSKAQAGSTNLVVESVDLVLADQKAGQTKAWTVTPTVSKGSLRLSSTGKPSKTAQVVFIINQAVSGQEIEAKVRLLEQEFTEKTYRVLNEQQRRKLKELVHQDLGSDR